MPCSPATKANEEDSSSLLPGLPDDVVLTHIITRLPWHVPPLCRALSTQWRSCIDTPTERPDIGAAKSCQHLLPYFYGDLPPCTLYLRVFLTKACNGPHKEWRSASRHARSQDATYRWRRLPWSKGLLLESPVGFGPRELCGMVYAWSEEPQSVASKTDLAGGYWIWKEIPFPHFFSALAVSFNLKFYAPFYLVLGEPGKGKMLHVHDITTQLSGLVETRDDNNLRVPCKVRQVTSYRMYGEELYSFVTHSMLSERKLEILAYEASSNSWRTTQMIPLQDFCWSEFSHIELVNGNCFEPAPNGGINTVWVDYKDQVFRWFNMCMDDTWIEFDYSTQLEGKTLQFIRFSNGRMYGAFLEEKGSKGDEEESKDSCVEYTQDELDSKLHKHILMEGKMVVEDNKVHWKEVNELSFFMDVYYHQPIFD